MENVRSLKTFVRWKRSFVSRSRARVSSAREVGRSGTISQLYPRLDRDSPPCAPISLLRIHTCECPTITMPLHASSEELTSDRDSKNGGVSTRRPSSVRDSITASMPRYVVFKHRIDHLSRSFHTRVSGRQPTDQYPFFHNQSQLSNQRPSNMDGFPSESSDDESMTVDSPVEVSVHRNASNIISNSWKTQKDKKIGQLTRSELVFLLYIDRGSIPRR